MSQKKQTRRTISVSGDTYRAAREYAQRIGVSLASVTDAYLRQWAAVDAAPAPRPTPERRLAVLERAGDQLRASLPPRGGAPAVPAPTRVEVPRRRGGAVLL